jgi:DNA-binding protein YbaB
MKQNNAETLQFELEKLQKIMKDKHEKSLIAKYKHEKKKERISVYIDTAREFKEMSISKQITHDRLLKNLMKGIK